MDTNGFRVESDSLGEMQIPNNCYYGASTQRAVDNFPISNLRFGRLFIKSLGAIKLTAAQANKELGLLDAKLADAIVASAQRVVDGEFDEQFVVDIFQTGSGTSTNMNANEIIANLAIEKLGAVVGSRSPVHPNDHVNLGQSSNDVIPTAIHISARLAIQTELLPAMRELEKSLNAKAQQFWDVVKTGRTHLQDATPIRLGQEFKGYAGQVQAAIDSIETTSAGLDELALGGTAVGTGIGTHTKFSGLAIAKLNGMLNATFKETTNHFQAQSTIDAVVRTSGALKAYAMSLMKIANDIRWLGSGPRAGIGEIQLPTVQPGSSIMPGKVNPVIAESVTMVCAQVLGNDLTVSVAGQSGNFELNVMLPVAAYNLSQSIELLATSSVNFERQCISGLEQTSAGPDMVERGLAIGTALAPIIGYDNATRIVKLAAKTDRTIREVALEETQLSAEELDKVLNPLTMTEAKSDV